MPLLDTVVVLPMLPGAVMVVVPPKRPAVSEMAATLVTVPPVWLSVVAVPPVGVKVVVTVRRRDD